MKAIYSYYLSSLTSNRVFYIDCSTSETGTHKDMRSKGIVGYAEKHGINSIHLITSGNAGLSLKHTIKQSGRNITLTHIVPVSIADDISHHLESSESRVIKVDLTRAFLSGEKIREIVGDESFDATYIKGPHYTTLIQAALEVLPDYVIVPLGSGELFNSFYCYIKENGSNTKIVGVIPRGSHPLSSRGTYEKTLADKLSCSFIHPRAEADVREALLWGHELHEANNKQIMTAVVQASEIGIQLEPSGAVSLAALNKSQNKTVVCVLTGRGK